MVPLILGNPHIHNVQTQVTLVSEDVCVLKIMASLSIDRTIIFCTMMLLIAVVAPTMAVTTTYLMGRRDQLKMSSFTNVWSLCRFQH